MHLLHALRGGRIAGGQVAGVEARTCCRHQRIPALHARQPGPDMVRLGYESQSAMDGVLVP